jgi:hypothetical protein
MRDHEQRQRVQRVQGPAYRKTRGAQQGKATLGRAQSLWRHRGPGRHQQHRAGMAQQRRP